MARNIAYLFLITTAACMEMRETVERMVVVRRTGSDLQPAATGFIYKKDNHGPASVVKMEETEVMEHLKKLPENSYKQPEAFAAPIPVAAGPFYAKNNDESKAESHASEAYIIPVKVEEAEDEHIDGVIDEDYGKYIGEYAPEFGDYKGDFDDNLDYYKSDFGDYLHGLGHYHGHHDVGGGLDYGSKGHYAHGDKGSDGHASNNHFGKGDAGDYHNENHESFSISTGGAHKKEYGDADGHGSDYAQGYGYKGDDHGQKAGHTKGEETDGYHNIFQKGEFKKDDGFYDGEAHEGGFGKFGDGHKYHGSETGGFAKGGSHDSGHVEGGFGKGGFHDHGFGDEHGVAHKAEEGEEASHHSRGEFGANDGSYDGKGYGFEVQHHR